MKGYILTLSIAYLLSGCIGTDLVDDPIVAERIEVSMTRLALLVGQSSPLAATYFNEFGVETPAQLKWISSAPLVAIIDSEGSVKALSGGQAMLVASLGSILSPSINVTVVTNESEVSAVEITSPANKISLAVGESHELNVEVKNINGETITGTTLEWFSENSSIATVDNNGKVTGVSNGMVDIHAKANGVKSNLLNFAVGGGLAGTFVSSGGYKAVGMALLKAVDGNIILELSSNFETSFALGTYIYMANVTNASQVRSSGLEVAQITTNGAKSFNLTAISPGIKLTDYSYVIILCKPATVTFGYAKLN